MTGIKVVAAICAALASTCLWWVTNHKPDTVVVEPQVVEAPLWPAGHNPNEGNSEDPVSDADVLTLAQACVAELGFRALDECWLQWHINADQGASVGVSAAAQSRLYNSILRKSSAGEWLVQTRRAKWVRGLNFALDKPPHFVGPWRTYRHLWQAILTEARRFLQDPGSHPCPDADHYGGDCEDEYGACDKVPACWTRVHCNPSYRQAYWHTRKCR